MLSLRLLLAAIFLVGLPFGLCSSSDNSSAADQLRAIKVALAAIGDNPNTVPVLGSEYQCTIHVSVQPQPPASPFHDVQGHCMWTLLQQGNLWLVTFHESWLCDDWSAPVPGYPACVPPIGSHQWQYQVYPDSSVQEITSSGPYAPDQH